MMAWEHQAIAKEFKCPGPDKASPRVLKECAQDIAMPLFLILDKSQVCRFGAERCQGTGVQQMLLPSFKE